MRIDKLLANLKYGSRNEIKKYCKDGLVKINGEIIKDSGCNVVVTDDIYLGEEKIYYFENITLMMNKPKDYICANKDGLHKTVLELVKEPYCRYDLNIAGRLDIDTEGLLILTTDGNLLHSIITPKKDVYKKYYVEYNGILKKGLLEHGVIIKDGKEEDYLTKEAKIEYLGVNKCYISIKEGKFHQVKRMFQYANCEVTYLKRIAIGEYVLNENLKLGEYEVIE